MKFDITRTSDIFREEIPCKGAVLTERKTSYNENVWEIEINSLEELIELSKEVNCGIILCRPRSVEGMYELEIYDDYRG